MQCTLLIAAALARLIAAGPPVIPADRAARWEKEIAAIEARLPAAPAKDAVLFLGSSSIRLWDTKAAFPMWATVNAGFGGSELRDTTHFLPRLLRDLTPRAIVVYAGDNDIASGRKPGQVRDDFTALARVVRAKRPDTPVYFIAIKPSPFRRGMIARQAEANLLVKAVCEAGKRLHYIDIVPRMIGPDGKPRPELFVNDGLHLNATGYAVWADIVGQAVGPVVTPQTQEAKPVAPAPPTGEVTLTSPISLGGRPGQVVTLPLPAPPPGRVLGVWSTLLRTATVDAADPRKPVLHICVPADAPIGLYPLRLAAEAGLSNVRPFCVDTYPEVAESGAHAAVTTAQPVANPCVVTGTADADAADFFRIPVRRGEPLTVEVLARRLGSPFDPVLTLLHPDGRPVAGAYADDTPGLQTDARVALTPAADGFLVAEVRDATYKGGPDHGYRLRIGSHPAALTTFPLAVEAGKGARIAFVGAPDLLPQPVTPAETQVTAAAILMHPTRGTAVGWPVPLRLTDVPQQAEVEPNDSPATANRVPLPGGVSAAFGKPGDRDHFRFAAQAGDKVRVTARTAEVLSPCEVLLRVLDGSGAEVGKSDPQQPVARAEFTAAAAGEYVAVAEHLNYLHGPTEVYWLQLDTARPDFSLTCPDPRVTVPAGGGLLPVTLTRLNGFDGPVELTVSSPDKLAGRLAVPAGAAGPMFVPIHAEPGAVPGPGRFAVVGTAVGMRRLADVTEAYRPAFPGVLVPHEWGTGGAAVVTGGPSVTVAATPTPPANPNAVVKVSLDLTRQGHDGAVTLTTTKPFALARPLVVPAGVSKVAAEVTVAAGSAGPVQLVVRAATAGGRPLGAAVAWVTVPKK